MTLWNSILWGNGGFQQFTFFSGTPSVGYSSVQNYTGSLGGIGVIASDPQFVLAGDWRLRATSPCIDPTDNNGVPPGIMTDLPGNARFVNVLATSDTGISGGQGGSAIVDMGAYEFEVACFADYNRDGGIDGADTIGFLVFRSESIVIARDTPRAVLRRPARPTLRLSVLRRSGKFPRLIRDAPRPSIPRYCRPCPHEGSRVPRGGRIDA